MIIVMASEQPPQSLGEFGSSPCFEAQDPSVIGSNEGLNTKRVKLIVKK